MDFSSYFHGLQNLRRIDEIRHELERLVFEIDTARVPMEHKETVEYGVFIPEKERLLRRLEARSRYRILMITGYNGDGKSTMLKALSVLLKDHGARYAFVSEELKDPAWYFLDGLDEAIMIDEEGERYLDPKASNALASIIEMASRRRLERRPVIGATRATILALAELRTDFQRRSEELLNLEKYRRESYRFVLMRDLCVYALIEHRPYFETAEIRGLLSPEVNFIDASKFTVSDVHKLYEKAFSIAFDSSKPLDELTEAPRRYNKEFEEAAVEALRRNIERISRAFSDIELEVIPLGGVNEPDAEIVVYSPEGEHKIAFEAKFYRRYVHKEPAYAKDYPSIVYFIASVERPQVDLSHRIPYSLGYVLARTGDLGTFVNFLDMKVLLIKALKTSKASKVVAEESSKIVVRVLEELLKRKRDPKEGRFKSFRESRLKKHLGIEEPSVAIALVNSLCGEEIIDPKKDRGRYHVKVRKEIVENCLKKLTGS